ncbi:MAG: siroheme synthase CysG [Steroidobacteraceae bacterium]
MDYLPVFLDLRGKGALVVGGGAVAARKIELLLKAGARVQVVAPGLHAEVRQLVTDGRVQHLSAAFSAEHCDARHFIIAATDQPEVNRAVAEAGAARGIWVNVVDDQAQSSCILPAIIDRDPVLVAVGTAGTSPTLARRLRARIEALLPEGLGALARFAGRWRAPVREALPDLAQRRRFWEQVLDGPVASVVQGGADGTAPMQAALRAAQAGAAQSRGAVWLIGAGPGDPDLLTLKALQLLQDADVVLYDRLVSPSVLERVRRDAERVFVGKEPGHHRTTQARIHELLLEYAGRGLRVARLKGGDPFIFGRGGEEVAVLTQAGIPVTVVPGITAALGAAASCGLPLTHRGVSQSVTFVTAMSEATELLNWSSLAAPLQTVVFYMGMAQLPRIVARLRAEGAQGTRGAVVIERATLPQQRAVFGTLADIEARAAAAGVGAPALLIVGDVAELEGIVRSHE